VWILICLCSLIRGQKAAEYGARATRTILYLLTWIIDRHGGVERAPQLFSLTQALSDELPQTDQNNRAGTEQGGKARGSE